MAASLPVGKLCGVAFVVLQLNSHIRVFDKLFHDLIPDLFEHFTRIELKTDMFLVEWILTLFTRVLPLDVVARVWDAFLVLDEVWVCFSMLFRCFTPGFRHCSLRQAFLMQTALGVLSSLRPELLAAELGECIQILRQVPSFRDPETLFHDICVVEVPHKLYQHLVTQELKVSRRQSPGVLPTLFSERERFCCDVLVAILCVLPQRHQGHAIPPPVSCQGLTWA
jgi:hypothetical protein